MVRFSFFLIDCLMLNFAIFISVNLAAPTSINNQIYLYTFSNIGWLYLSLIISSTNSDKFWNFVVGLKSHFSFLFVHIIVVASLITIFKKDYSALQILTIYLVFTPLFLASRILVFLFRKETSNRMRINYVLLGRDRISREIRRYYLMNRNLDYRFIGDFPTNEGVPRLIELLSHVNKRYEIHEIICRSDIFTNKELKPLINFSLDSLIRIKFVDGSRTFVNEFLKLNESAKQSFISHPAIRLDESQNLLIKRLFDLIFTSIFILTILTWLLPIISLLIKLDSKGPVFFKQLRSGRNNKPFTCYKFRTMEVNKISDSIQATKNDPRITPFGAFLRKSSIDEFPQFFNVLIGNMSVIGPRPHMLKHTEEYNLLIDRFMGRHYVKPGITGLAQCLGYRGETQTLADMENRVRLDRYYIENWTFWLDIKIIFLTVISLIRGSDKAY
jgi:putative colanic acid biosysnthesis UDP-glucose lipid carrier transferase